MVLSTISGPITITYTDSGVYNSDLTHLLTRVGDGTVSNPTHNDSNLTISVILTNYS